MKCFISIIFCLSSLSIIQDSYCQTETKIQDNVKVINNSNSPRHGKIIYKLEEELTIGEEYENDNYIFHMPFDIKVTDNGTIYVFDLGYVRIQVYDKYGKYLRTIGKEGQGPGEINISISFDITNNGEIVITDRHNTRISILDTNGVYIKSFRIMGKLYSMFTDLNDYIYFAKEFHDGKNIMMNIYRYDTDGKEILNYGKFMADQLILVKQGNKFNSIRTIFEPTTVWAVSKEGRLYTGLSNKYLINVYSPNGKLAFQISRDHKRVLNKLKNKEKFSQSDYFPVFHRQFLFDDNNNLWIQIFHNEDKLKHIYDIFSNEGIYIKQVIVEHPIFYLSKGKMYSIFESDDGIKMIKRYGIK